MEFAKEFLEALREVHGSCGLEQLRNLLHKVWDRHLLEDHSVDQPLHLRCECVSVYVCMSVRA